MSIFYKINRFNKSDFHKPICLKNTGDGIENNNGDFNKITDSISGDGETKEIKNEGDTKSVPFEGVKGRDSIKVARFFQNHQDEHFTPKQIACYCNISHSSAKKICMRWYLKNWINHVNNEYEFTQKITADELKKIERFLDQKYHNFMLVLGHTQGDRRGVTPSKETNEISKESKFHVGEMQFMIKSISVKILIYPQKSVFHIKCSEDPIDYGELMRVIGTIEGKAGYSLETAYIERIEPNIDFPDLQIDGAQRLELRTFSKCWQRFYNKRKNLMRKEYIIRGAHIPLEEVLAVARGEQILGTNVLAIELEELRKEKKQMKEAIIKMSDNYREVIVAIDRLKSAGKKSKEV